MIVNDVLLSIPNPDDPSRPVDVRRGDVLQVFGRTANGKNNWPREWGDVATIRNQADANAAALRVELNRRQFAEAYRIVRPDRTTVVLK